MPPDEQNPSLSTVQATLEGLDRYLKTEFANIREQINPLSGLPVEVATLNAKHSSLEARVREMEIDKENSSNKTLQYISMAIVLLIGLGTMIISIVQASAH